MGRKLKYSKDININVELKRFYITSYKKHLVEQKYKVKTINKKMNSLVCYNQYLISTGVMAELVVNLRKDKLKIAEGSEHQVLVLTDVDRERLLFFIQDKSKVSIRDKSHSMDYLQVFDLLIEDGKQVVAHKQELPELYVKKHYPVNVPLTLGRIFIIDDVPIEVVAEIRRVIMILDENYGADRKVDSDFGGYILVIESLDDLNKLSEIHLDLEELVPEYVDVIRTSKGDYDKLHVALELLNGELVKEIATSYYYSKASIYSWKKKLENGDILWIEIHNGKPVLQSPTAIARKIILIKTFI